MRGALSGRRVQGGHVHVRVHVRVRAHAHARVHVHGGSGTRASLVADSVNASFGDVCGDNSDPGCGSGSGSGSDSGLGSDPGGEDYGLLGVAVVIEGNEENVQTSKCREDRAHDHRMTTKVVG